MNVEVLEVQDRLLSQGVRNVFFTCLDVLILLLFAVGYWHTHTIYKGREKKSCRLFRIGTCILWLSEDCIFMNGEEYHDKKKYDIYS